MKSSKAIPPLKTISEHVAWIGAMIVLALIMAPSPASADGGVVRAKETQGPFVVTLFTPAQVSRGLPTDVTVLVQRSETGEVAMDASVELSFDPPAGATIPSNDPLCSVSENMPSPGQTGGPGRPPSLRATRTQALNKLLYGISVVFPVAGTWQMRAVVRGGNQEATVTCALPVGRPTPRLETLWPYLTLPPVAIALFALNQWLRGRPPKSVSIGTGRQAIRPDDFVMQNNLPDSFTTPGLSGAVQGGTIRQGKLI